MSDPLTKEEREVLRRKAASGSAFIMIEPFDISCLLSDLERTEANLQSMIVERDKLLEEKKELEARLDRIVEEVEQPKCSYGLAGRVLALAKGKR